MSWKPRANGPTNWPSSRLPVRPRKISMPPSVTMNEGYARIGDQHPCAAPMPAPMARLSTITIGIGPFRVDHQRPRHGADEADDRADRQVDVAADDHQQHPQRHDDDVGVLRDDVGDVDGCSRAHAGVRVGVDIRRSRRSAAATAAARSRAGCPSTARAHLLGGGRIGGDGGRAHAVAPYWRMIDAMIFSWLASLAGISSTNRPSFIT